MSTLADWKRALMALYPPGAFSRDPDSLHGILAEADAKVLFAGAQVIEQLEREIFPRTAEQTLDEWESIFRAPHAPGASTSQRQDAICARWRNPNAFTPEGIRTIVGDLLQPEYAWRDTFDNGVIDWRYIQSLHTCTLVESSACYQILNATTTNAAWDATNKLGATVLLPLLLERHGIVRDNFWLSAQVLGNHLSDGGMVGVCLYESMTDAQWWGLQKVSGAAKVCRSGICGNVVLPVDVDVAEPTAPYWLTIGRVDGGTRVYVGASMPSPFSSAGLTEIGTIGSLIHPRWAGFFLRNDGAANMELTVGDLRLAYGERRHNVEIVENRLATLSGPTDDHRFFCFIRRNPLDFGYAQLKRAQLELDKVKPAHLNLTVGETNWFLCENAHSLTDRDVIGQ